MDLYARLFENEPNIPIHWFRAAIGDYIDGAVTRAQIIGFWDLDSEAQADLNALCNAIDGKNALGKAQFRLTLHDVMALAEGGLRYRTRSAFRARLGL